VSGLAAAPAPHRARNGRGEPSRAVPNLWLTRLPSNGGRVEVVERKGCGHPDSICDALAENLSRALCRRYQAAFGVILHHNVDKALLCAGRASPAFGGGRIAEPMDIYLAGRAAALQRNGDAELKELAMEGARSWLREHLHALDAEHHVRIHPVLRPGSPDLRGLFAGSAVAIPLANDTSIGVGYAPLSALEQLVLDLERALHDASRPAWGEDVKIMAVRTGEDVTLTISCALIGGELRNLDAYLAEKAAIADLAAASAAERGFRACRVAVNAADQPEAGLLYLTVTGTSAESGDDGQVGRGNRVSGLITPGRPMSLEAAAGKNPVTHVGKIYNVAAQEIARSVVAELAPVRRAECLLVSQIGAPITEPAVAELRCELARGEALRDVRGSIEAVVARELAALPGRLEDFVHGRVALF